MSRRNLDGSLAVTHAVSFDNYRRGRKSVAECGELVHERDIAPNGEPPTCLECRVELVKTALDVFGAPVSDPSQSPYGDPLRDYSPKDR